MINIENVNKYFNKGKKNQIHVINNTTLSLEDSGLVALLGPSGSGKTTLLNAIGGLDKVNKGNIYINGKKITSKSSYKVDKIRNLNIGYIFQDYKLLDNLTVYENVAIVLKMLGIKDKEEIKKRVTYVLEKLNIYRYRNRPADMLSGGERQRVAIARAIVKDPDIIIADEPTGNLDSANTIEIMNIIKSISKDRLVILVTHEKELAMFYATRIIELEDGIIIKDYENKNINELDYQMDNKIYLKDFKYNKDLSKDNVNIDYYSDNLDKLNIKIVVKNGNIYIKTENKNKIEILDNNSSIELVNDHYKKIDKKTYENYSFDFDKIINKDIPKKYSSIYNIFSLLKASFKKILNYSVLKKILLLGFFASAVFIVYAFSSTIATITINDESFISLNKNYLVVRNKNIEVDKYLEYEQNESINYMLPGNSNTSFDLEYSEYYQTNNITDTLTGSIASINLINEKDLIYGRMPENNNEVVVDYLTIKRMFNNGIAKNAGVTNPSKILNKKITKGNLTFEIVGITSLKDPTIYVNDFMLMQILAEKNNNFYEEVNNNIYDYGMYLNDISLVKGSLPVNDYEVIISDNNIDSVKLNTYLNEKINGNKLKVVGFYHSVYNKEYYLVNFNTLKYKVITDNSGFVIYANNKKEAEQYFKDLKLDVIDSYTNDKNIYVSDRKDYIISSLVVSGIMLLISMIEIFLMIRSSFLSRIKEIGILRAIGIKKTDIYKMFIGETLAITTVASLPGIILSSYILKILSSISYLSNYLTMNIGIVIMSIIFVYLFNTIIGLIPVLSVSRKTPAMILSRHDLD